MIKVRCENKHCRIEFEARKADRKRGWARFCSKSCKAIKQTNSRHNWIDFEEGWDGHKDSW